MDTVCEDSKGSSSLLRHEASERVRMDVDDLGAGCGLVHKCDDLLFRSEILTGVIATKHDDGISKAVFYPDTRHRYRSVTSAAKNCSHCLYRLDCAEHNSNADATVPLVENMVGDVVYCFF